MLKPTPTSHIYLMVMVETVILRLKNRTSKTNIDIAVIMSIFYTIYDAVMLGKKANPKSRPRKKLENLNC